MKRPAVTLVLVGLCAALAGCGGARTVSPTAQTVIGTVAQGPSVSGGNAGAGKQLYAANGCGGCHTYRPAGTNGKVGPDLDNVAADAKKANQGPVPEYVATSIKNPQAYVVPGFPAGVMPAFTSLSDKQLADLVAFLTQKS
jgi:cytochrome c1